MKRTAFGIRDHRQQLDDEPRENAVTAALKNLVGGEIEEYTKLMAEAREQALDRMVAQARARGANAVLTVRFTTSYIMTNASEILSYGEAVVIEPVDDRSVT